MSELWRLEGGGTLSLQEDGLRVRLEAVRPEDGRLYKVWVWGDGGRFLLGTPAPERGALRLCRTVSRQSLMQAGCWPVRGGEAEQISQGETPERWAPEPRPERLCGDKLVEESLRGQEGFCARRQGEETLLSAPFRPDRPFPIPVLFCLAQVELRAGRPWLVWRFRRDGTPVVPEENSRQGQTDVLY